MVRKGLTAAAALVALSVSAGSGLALPVAPLHEASSVVGAQAVTFWGRVFPYQYTWSLTKACTRYVPVETGRGMRLRRVWVCRDKWRR